MQGLNATHEGRGVSVTGTRKTGALVGRHDGISKCSRDAEGQKRAALGPGVPWDGERAFKNRSARPESGKPGAPGTEGWALRCAQIAKVIGKGLSNGGGGWG